MSKRRRASSAASRGADLDDSDDAIEHNPGPPPSRKKKKLDPGEMCQQLYDTIRSFKKEDGTLLCDSFIRAPKRRQEPQYYEVVSQPIDLLRVQQKLKTDTYEDIEELSADIDLLVSNAKAFYKPDATEYKDAVDLWKLYTQTRNSLESGEEIKTPKLSRNGSSSRRSDVAEDMSETSTNMEEDIFEELFSSVMTANIEGRPLYRAFQFLPSKRRYPEYFSVIESPIDLKTIAQKIQGGEYLNLTELEKDLVLMVRNACHFNEPGSQIYKDAKMLKKVIQVRRQELDLHGRGPAKTSERIRSKRTSRVGPVPTSRTLAIMDPPGTENEHVKHSEDSGDSDDDKGENEDSPQWKLLEVVRNHLGTDGTPMSEPFWKLPSRRAYPDYYKEIKNPVSLNQIRNKIRRGSYGTLSEVAGDMNIMFENAKQYNVPSSKLYKDAVKLQRLMQQRVQELLDIVQESSSDDESLSSVKNQSQTPISRPRGRPRINPLPATDRPSPATTPTVSKSNLPLRKKLHYVSKQLVDFTCSDGRQPMLLFMEKPSKKLYPEYYNVIDRPIDMITIENNIKHDRYATVDDMVADFRLLFSNCRQFNEEGSMIYEDANLLERVMNEKLKEINSTDKKTPVRVIKSNKGRQLSPFEQKLRTLYDAIRDYRDPKANRQLALIFMKLPSKTEYPDYYELIKNPIDMEKIAHKLKNSTYQAVNELASDFILMFDNACKYNEPDSQIYKDALILHRVCLQTKQMLSREDDDAVPDVPAAVQELLLNLFTSVYNHQDEEGRCYSDSMAELPEHDETGGGEKVRAISLDLVKRRLDKGLYKRLDHFQQDMFAVFERARRLSRTDSQIFEDSVELQSYLIAQRDVLCAATLLSPALAFTRDTVTTSVELVKQCKLLQEAEEEDDTRSSTDDSMPPGAVPTQQTQYCKGDFVYVQPEKGNKEPAIVHIERVWTNNDGLPMIYANIYYRPQETFHVRTRKFLQQEVFKTELHRTIPLDHIMGHCYVMNVKEYFKLRPQGLPDKDVYVCESRYQTKHRGFKKIKIWEGGDKDALVPREVPLEPSRTVSVFRERVEKHKDELAELEILENVQEKERPDVVMYNPLGTDDENTYYEQYNTVCSGVIKTGDYVYVATDGGKQMIAQVDTIWETGDNKCYFRGPFLIFPNEVANIINKPFYKQEVLLTTMHDTSPLVGIVGKCSVLDYDDYLKCRPTEVAENDVYVCESVYDESNRVARKLKSGLRRFEHTKDVTVDEIYLFPKAMGPPPLATAADVHSAATVFNQKQFHPQLNADSMDGKPQFTNLINTTIGQDVEMMLDNSLDDSSLASPATPLSVGGNSNPYNPTLSTTQERTPAATPATGKKKKESKQKIVTGYILYSSEVRKAIIANNPEGTFGEISRIVGNEWRSLPASTKQTWEERAARCNEETTATARLAEEMRELTQNVGSGDKGHKALMEMTYECAWDTCDMQFEDLADCLEHCVGDGGNNVSGTGHVQTHYRGSHAEYPCVWRACARVRKGQAPFPNLPRVVRHVRDLHVNKGNGRMMHVHERSRNFMPSSKKPKVTVIRSGVMSPGASLSGMSPLARNTPSPGALEPAPASVTPRAALDPLFVTAPPRAQRLTHSEAYIRYIEGLHSEQKYITPWEKSLTPMPINPDPNQYNMNKLPAHWMTEEAINGFLAQDKSLSETDIQRMDQNTKILKGLCALRDFMMKDALCLYKNF